MPFVAILLHQKQYPSAYQEEGQSFCPDGRKTIFLCQFGDICAAALLLFHI
jgi:hypothetical protein